MTDSFTSTFGALPVQWSKVPYLAISLTGNISLDWATQATDTNLVLAGYNNVTPQGNGFTITLASAQNTSKGTAAMFANTGSFSYTVLGNDGSTIVSVAPSQVVFILLTSNATVGGSWQIVVLGSTTTSANAASLAGAGLAAMAALLAANWPVRSLMTNYTATASDRATVLVWAGGAGTISLTAPSTVGAGYLLAVANLGSGILTVAPLSGGIDNGSTVTLNPNENIFLFTDGTQYISVGHGRSISVTFTRLVVNVAGSSNVTLTAAQAANQILEFTGTLTGNISVFVPATVAEFFAYNNTAGAFTLELQTVSGTGQIITQGTRRILHCDGTNVVFSDTSAAGTVTSVATDTTLTGGPITSTGTLGIANTAVSPGSYNFGTFTVNAQGQLTAASNPTLTVNAVLVGNGAGAVSFVGPGASGLPLVGAGAAAVPTFTALGPSGGGLGATGTPTNGQIPIGNGTNYTPATLTAGSGVKITNASGSVTVGLGGQTVSVKTSGPYNIAASDIGSLLVANSASAITFNLPAGSTAAQFFFRNIGAGVLTISPNGSDTIASGPSTTLASLALSQGDSGSLVTGLGSPAVWYFNGARHYDSGQQAITPAGALTLAHGLGIQPALVLPFLHCITGENNFSIGDEISVAGYMGNVDNVSPSQGFMMLPDVTNLNVRFGTGTVVFQVHNKTTGAAGNVTNANWKLILRAYVTN